MMDCPHAVQGADGSEMQHQHQGTEQACTALHMTDVCFNGQILLQTA